MRIAHALAVGGIDSRRKCEVHVLNGAVCVNGEVVKDLGRQVCPEEDSITFRGKRIEFKQYVYLMMHKLAGYTTTAADPHNKQTVYDLLPRHLVRASSQTSSSKTRVFPVGRLDRDSTGLLLFTNDGNLVHKLTHPRYGVSKMYLVKLDRRFEVDDQVKLKHGVRLYDGRAKAQSLKVVSPRTVRVMIREGRNRQVRRMFQKLEYEVVRLARVGFGPISLGVLPPGQTRWLSAAEIKSLKEAV
ncbi:MAG: pseudouridine synthase [Candidatus Omnitrophota bacterium]|nr:pseudouridine synthase [Candidatus Omnitrophota bacterium]